MGTHMGTGIFSCDYHSQCHCKKKNHKLKLKRMKFNTYVYGPCVTHKRAVSVKSK
jgi:hypothetical protein